MSGGWSRYTREAARGSSGCGAAIAAPLILAVVVAVVLAITQTPREYLYVWLWFGGAVAVYAGLCWLVQRHLS